MKKKKKQKQKKKKKKKKKKGVGGTQVNNYIQLFKTSHSTVLADTNPLAQNVSWKGSILTIEKQKLWTNVEVS